MAATIIRPVLLPLALILAAGCSGSGTVSDSAAPAPPPVAREAVEEQASPQSEAAGPVEPAATPRLTLPEDFPPAIPLLQRRRIISISPRDQGSVSLTYSTPETPAAAAVFYREQLAAAAWELSRDSLSGGMTTLAARQDQDARLTVNIIAGEDGTSTMVGLYYQPPVPADDQ